MSVTLHCDVGDIKLELYCEQCPKTCENFLALAASNYYNDCLFHRNIKGFMVGHIVFAGNGKVITKQFFKGSNGRPFWDWKRWQLHLGRQVLRRNN